MDEMDLLVHDSTLPNQLKEYFTASKSIKMVLTNDTIKEIEDLYIFYNSLYIFDSSDFSAYVITSLRKCTNLEKFYPYLKKIMDTNLKFESKDQKIADKNHRFYIDISTANTIFVETFNDFSRATDIFHKGDIENVNLIQTYKVMGKMELVNVLIDDKNYKNLLNMGKNILNQYIKCDG